MTVSLAHLYPWTSPTDLPDDVLTMRSSKCNSKYSVFGATKSPSDTPTPIPTSIAYSTPSTAPSHFLSLPPNPSSSYSSSLYPPPPDIYDPILEEGDEDSGIDSPAEPVTPVSGGRHSQDSTHHSHQYNNDCQALSRLSTAQKLPSSTHHTFPLLLSPTSAPLLAPVSTSKFVHDPVPGRTPDPAKPYANPTSTPTLRRTGRTSTSNLRRKMSRLFRRSNSTLERDKEYHASDPSIPLSESAPHSNTYLNGNGVLSSRYPNGYQSSTTTRSNSPPSPGSPLEMCQSHHSTNGTNGSLPNAADFKKKGRASTNLTLRGRAVNFVGHTMGRGHRTSHKTPRRASSFDIANRAAMAAVPKHVDGSMYPPERLPWPLPPDAGTGIKARRMSLILPDDFTVDVAELLSEFEYQSKFLGRHGKHLGKGAASKVTLMVRKGCPGELYAVKEFRGKSNRESQEDYEKKIKSEFSIGKSLHHPNIVETIRLCTDHGRWNHVMEYCSEGDLFGLVQKGFLKGEDKKKDRLCLFKQLAQGVNYLHSNGIAHRDIKLENLLLTKDSKLKITDFGVSEVFSGTHPGLRESGGQCGQNMGDVRLCSPGICGSEPYIAPEVLEKKESYDARALDVWSSAIVMIYLTFGGAIWSRAESGNLHYDKLVKGWDKWYGKHGECEVGITDADYPNCYALDVGVNPPALRRILLQMLNPNPSKRITINEVVNNRWVKNVECCQVESYEEQQTIDATKRDQKGSAKKIFCHNHLPPKSSGSHSLGKMPGQAGY